MIELLVIGALLGGVVYFSIREGKSGERLKQKQELINAIQKAKDARAAIDDIDHRKLLIEELRKRGEDSSLRRDTSGSDKRG